MPNLFSNFKVSLKFNKIKKENTTTIILKGSEKFSYVVYFNLYNARRTTYNQSPLGTWSRSTVVRE